MFTYNALTLQPGQILAIDPCIFWARECAQVLLDSLQRQGQLQPVLVQKSNTGYTLVAGYSRFQGLKKLGRKIYALQTEDPDPWEKGLTYLSSNLGRIPDTLMLVRAMRYFSPLGKDLQQIYLLLGISRGSRQERQLQAWTRLPHEWDGALQHTPQLLTCAPDLTNISHPDLDTLLPFFQDLSWSLNNARKLLDLLRRTQQPENLPLEEIVARLALDKILAGKLSPKDKIRLILDSLGRAAYPEYFRLMDEARQNIKSLVSGTVWNCIHPDNFESPALELRVRVHSRDELNQASRQLSSIATSEHIRTWPVYPYE